MEFREFADLEEMFNAMERGTQAAIAAASPEQNAITYGDYFIRPYLEYDLLIFGYIMTEEELYSSSAYEGVEQAEIDYEKSSAKRNYDRGYRFGRAYSVAVVDGELGDTHVSTMIPITKENFEAAKAVNWDADEIAQQGWFQKLVVGIL